MRACLYEALRKDRQAFLRRAETIMLIRDESKGLLLVRLMACDVDLNTRVFTLGVTANAGSDAFDIDRATKGLLRGFCTPLADKEPDQPLLEHVANKIEAVCVDSASNELKAGRLMKETFAPNMKAVIRDRAHATRRLLSRPWAAEPELEDVAHVFVMGRHSLCQRIHHSPRVRAIFCTCGFGSWTLYGCRAPQEAHLPRGATASFVMRCMATSLGSRSRASCRTSPQGGGGGGGDGGRRQGTASG